MNKINEDVERYDLIFMDIIMPQLDGVSATAMIRVNAPTLPLIAMTSNIRQEDIATYFNWGKGNPKQPHLCQDAQGLTRTNAGMNDVLAKPFTKDGMVRILKKHLSNMLRDPPPSGILQEDAVQTGGAMGAPAPAASSQAFGAQVGIGMGSMAAPQSMGGTGGGMKFEHTHLAVPSANNIPTSPRAVRQP